MEKIKEKLVSGLRVKLVQGDYSAENGISERVWVAGRIPVGCVGTIRKKRNGPFHVVWDGILSNHDELSFTLVGGYLPNYLVLIESKEKEEETNVSEHSQPRI